MQHPFSALEPEYHALLAHMVVTRAAAVDQVARRLLKFVPDHYAPVAAKTGVPAIWLATTFEREASSNFHLYFGNGDPLTRRTTHVPKGRGPFVDGQGHPDWVAGTIDGLGVDHIDRVTDWSWPRACYEWELWNGFGPRNHGKHTGYDWAGTNAYTGGKYIADGKWSPTTQDTQLGTVPVARRMAELEPSLDMPGWPGADAALPPPLPVPLPAPVGLHNARALQTMLNRLIGAELLVDGNYGRRTVAAVREFQARHGLEVDGIAGPATWNAIESA